LAGAEIVTVADPPGLSTMVAEVPEIRIPALSIPVLEETAKPVKRAKLQIVGRRAESAPVSPLALVAFLLSLLGPFGFFPAIVCGHLAKWQLRRNAALKGDTFATAGLVIGYTCAVFTIAYLLRSALQKL
jgi:hypothetical protein